MQQVIRLLQEENRQPIMGLLLNLEQKHLDDVETLWREQLRLYQQSDKLWDWSFKRSLSLRREDCESYAIECNRRTQGLMSVETQGRFSQSSRGQPIVYIQALATAPWNRRNRRRPAEFQGVGRTLLLFAQQRSLELGYAGRVGLHALREVEVFYENQGMMRFDPDPDEYFDPEDPPLTYFEYPPFTPSS